MQRPAWATSDSRGNGLYTSCQSSTRVDTGRRVGPSRFHLRKPVISPMRGDHHAPMRFFKGDTALLRFTHHAHDALVVAGHDLAEPLDRRTPIGQKLGRER